MDHVAIPPYESVALVLQGGGALGAYQAGVFEGLSEAGIALDGLAGISIGALNLAVIAGNAPERQVERLREFWETICEPNFGLFPHPMVEQSLFNLNDMMREGLSALHAMRAMVEGQRGFFVPKLPMAYWSQQDPRDAGLYDTRPLRQTLERLCDFDRINQRSTSVAVGAVNVRTGNFTYFDNQRQRLRPEHFMASGALPPAFAPVEIDGDYYWDGGLVSNTPLAHVLDARLHRDTLVFQVDLWSARGRVPVNLGEVYDRVQDIRYSSRTRLVTDQLRQTLKLRRLVQELLHQLPEALRDTDRYRGMAQTLACDKRYNIVHLIYRNQPYEQHYKDFQFGLATMRDHWRQGLEDIRATLAQPRYLEMPPDDVGFVTHDVHAAAFEARMNGEGRDR